MPEGPGVYLAIFAWLAPVMMIAVVTVKWFRKRRRRDRVRTLCLPLAISGLELIRGTRAILHDSALTVEPGQIVTILGANGTGKTSLLEILAGRLPASHGEFLVDHQPVDPAQIAWRSRVAYCPADGGTVGFLTVAEHLALARTLVNPEAPGLDIKEQHLPEYFGLQHHLHERASRLSDGLRKRLGIALVLMGPAEIYLFDEPTVSLDAQGVILLAGILQAIRKVGRSAVVTTHALPLLQSVSDSILELCPTETGSVLQPGSRVELIVPDSSDVSPDWLFP